MLGASAVFREQATDSPMAVLDAEVNTKIPTPPYLD
jgi:hypothetical protein